MQLVYMDTLVIKMLLVVLYACIGLVLSAIPPKCCIDNQFEATMGEFGGAVTPEGKPHILNGYNHMSYDYYKRMMRLESHMMSENGSEEVTHILIDYKAQKEYVTSDTGCKVYNIKETMRGPCVPDNALYRGTSMFGIGTEGLRIQDWEYTVNDTDNTIHLAVTEEGCIPFIQTAYGTMNNAATNVAYFISDFHPGLQDKSVFNIPQDCHEGPQVVGKVGRTIRAVKSFYSK